MKRYFSFCLRFRCAIDRAAGPIVTPFSAGHCCRRPKELVAFNTRYLSVCYIRWVNWILCVYVCVCVWWSQRLTTTMLLHISDSPARLFCVINAHPSTLLLLLSVYNYIDWYLFRDVRWSFSSGNLTPVRQSEFSRAHHAVGDGTNNQGVPSRTRSIIDLVVSQPAAE